MNAAEWKDTLASVADTLRDRLPRGARAGDERAGRGRIDQSRMTGRIVQINLSAGGVPKLPVAEAVVTRDGIVGDRQKHTSFHGGPTRAVSLYSLELIERLRADGHPIEPGSTGENVTVSGLDWPLLRPGSRLALGDEVLLEITAYASPCGAISGSFADRRVRRIAQKVNPGESRLYARVLKPGRIAVDQEVRSPAVADDQAADSQPDGERAVSEV